MYYFIYILTFKWWFLFRSVFYFTFSIVIYFLRIVFSIFFFIIISALSILFLFLPILHIFICDHYLFSSVFYIHLYFLCLSFLKEKYGKNSYHQIKNTVIILFLSSPSLSLLPSLLNHICHSHNHQYFKVIITNKIIYHYQHNFSSTVTIIIIIIIFISS